jgi:putative PIG3 family NAD(P)H quinone oxidoreductase
MKAVLVKEPGGPEQLYLGDAERPVPGEKGILVKVRAASLNRMDILQREGRYPVPQGASPILGVDISGTVEELGPSSTRWQIGDRVMALLSGGGYAEYATVHEDLALPLPETFSFEQGAAVPEVFMTAYQTLFFMGKTQKQQTVLIHAGASGVGTAAIQLVRESGARSFVTAGSREKVDFCMRLGASDGFNYRKESFVDRLKDLTEGVGVDVILDFVGAPYWSQNLEVLKRNGRLIIIGYMGGNLVPQMDLSVILRKWIHVIGTTLRARSQSYRIELAQETTKFCLDRFAEGKLRPIIDRVYPWEKVREAHRYMEANKNTGKIVMNQM